MSFQWSQVLSTREVGGALVHLRIATPSRSDGAPGFTTPGQYTQLKVSGAMGYFAIASAPGLPELEFLVKRGSTVGEALARCQVGDMVEVGPIAGKGFPLEHARGRDLLLVATGTGSAPMHSVLEVLRARREEVNAVTFLHGVRTPADAEWMAERDWRAARIDWRIVVSRPPPFWTGRVGRVQDHLAGIGHDLTTAFLCGQKMMVAEATGALVAQGVPATRVFLNG
ncbi:MAG: NAD-binding oxidoreductase [Myxococcaceae bacterium]|nr:NAD-binding oxidoreductase [Myxococcaceae bacterium]